jgi:predicted AAA+ superfamily ATPase
LLHGVAQSLAGRTAMLNLLPLGHDELLSFPDAPRDLFSVLWHGGYPAIFDRRPAPGDWLGSYVATYVERDVRQVLNVTDLLAFQTFLRLCAGRSAQLLNLSALAGDAGITHNTARAWLSVLEASDLVFRLPALHVNVRKRLVKAPKLHFYDTGLLCYLLGITSPDQLRRHPLRGAVFETWVVAEIIKARLHRGLPASLSFYRDRKGEEIDAILERGDAVVAVEAKSGQTVAADFFPPLARFAESTGHQLGGQDVETVVAYGGDRSETRNGCRVLPWDRIKDFDWAGAPRRASR